MQVSVSTPLSRRASTTPLSLSRHASDVNYDPEVPDDEPIPSFEVDVSLRVLPIADNKAEFETVIEVPSGRISIGDIDSAISFEVTPGRWLLQVAREPSQAYFSEPTPNRSVPGVHQRPLRPVLPRLPPPLRDTGEMIEVRRDEDDELCGWVAEASGCWLAMTVFGAELGHRDDYDEAVQLVLDEGLASLAGHWVLSGPDVDGEQIVCIQHASQRSVTLALDYYSTPGVPSLTLSSDQLRSGLWTLVRSA